MKDKYKQAIEANIYADQFSSNHMNIQDWFMLAWARNIPELTEFPQNNFPILNLGAGHRNIGKSVSLDLEHGWDAEKDDIPYADESISGIWAHGFFEHISPERIPFLLLECQRVLCLNGVLNIVVPHALSDMYVEDFTHKSLWHEDTLDNLFNNPYYYNGIEHKWQFRIHTQFIMGVVWRNLGLFIQLVKEEINTNTKQRIKL